MVGSVKQAGHEAHLEIKTAKALRLLATFLFLCVRIAFRVAGARNLRRCKNMWQVQRFGKGWAGMVAGCGGFEEGRQECFSMRQAQHFHILEHVTSLRRTSCGRGSGASFGFHVC